MNRKVLGVALVVMFCVTWWLVAGEAWGQTHSWSEAVNMNRDFFYIIYFSDLQSHFLKQALWGIGAGLLADVLLLVGVVAWQKITFKP